MADDQSLTKLDAYLDPKLAESERAAREAAVMSDPAAKAALGQTVSLVDKMATKGIIHRNTAGRYKSRLAARVQKANA